MTQIEKDIAEIIESLSLINKVLGIGMIAPANLVDIRRKAVIDAEKIKPKLNIANRPPKHSYTLLVKGYGIFELTN